MHCRKRSVESRGTGNPAVSRNAKIKSAVKELTTLQFKGPGDKGVNKFSLNTVQCYKTLQIDRTSQQRPRQSHN